VSIKRAMNCQNPWMVKKGRKETRLYDGKMVFCIVIPTMPTSRCRNRSPSARFIPFCSISPKSHVCSRSRGDMKGGGNEVRTGGVEVGCMEEPTG
jgi:hypothetical protein